MITKREFYKSLISSLVILFIIVFIVRYASEDLQVWIKSWSPNMLEAVLTILSVLIVIIPIAIFIKARYDKAVYRMKRDEEILAFKKDLNSVWKKK